MTGYITLVDRKTNVSDRVVIRGYSSEISDDAPFTEYVFDKITSKLISRHISKSPYLPYTTALDILDIALDMDKKHKHYVDLRFTYEPHTKPVIKVDKVVKEVFPLPAKTITYEPKAVFANVTYPLSRKYIFTNLEASLYAYNYNNILVRSGYLGDRVFYSSCGRLLMRTDWLMQSVKGRRQLKAFLPDSYDAIRSVSSPFVQSYGLKMKSRTVDIPVNESYSNNFHKAHSLVSQRLADVNIEYAVSHPELVSELIEKQLEIYSYEFERDYYKNLVANIPSYYYLDINDILRLHIDADFRTNLDKYIVDIRKIYNANKDRAEFKGVCSDGRILC